MGYSIASYCNPKKVKEWKCGKMCRLYPNIQDVQIINDKKTKTQGFLGYNPLSNNIVIVFRGTLPWFIKNIIEDFSFDLVDLDLCNNTCKVHHGFLKCYDAIKSQFWTAFNYLRARYPNAQIQLTGHSLGGAIATLIAADISLQINQPITFYTFGSPRIGNPAWAEWFLSTFHGHYYRVTHGRDLIVHMGLEAMDYRHIPQEIFYQVHKDYKYVMLMESQRTPLVQTSTCWI